MPWIGVREGKNVIPEGVETGEVVLCPDCDGPMFPRGPSSDGRARHFVHKTEAMGGSGGGSCAGGSGESDLHRRYKNHAVSRLRELFEGEYDIASPEYRLGEEATLPSGGDFRDADALVRFTTPSPKLGLGIIIEVQYRNEGKDVDAVEDDYLSLGYSVLWADESDFIHDRCTLSHQDIIDRAVPVWPNAVPQSDEWRQPSPDGLDLDAFRLLANWKSSDSCDTEALVRQDSNTEEVDPYSTANTAFTPPDSERFEPPILESILPPEFIDEIALAIYREQRWESLFSPPLDYTDIWCYAKVPATLPPGWHRRKQREMWEESPWDARFRGTESFSTGARGEIEIEIDFAQFLGREATRGSRELTALLRRAWFAGRKDSCDSDPDPPSNPYDDVQCRDCGAFWSISRRLSDCPQCGDAVNFDWNISSGRISASAYEEYYGPESA